MAVLCLIVLLEIFGILSVRYDRKWFILISLFSLSLLYVLLEPTDGFDLYRHYEIYDYVKAITWDRLFDINSAYNTSYSALLYNIYLDGSPAYIVYVFILSRIAGKKLLIFATTMLTYGIPMYTTYSIGKRIKASNTNITVALGFIMACINYLDISNIRNILAVSVVSLGLFWDLLCVRRKTASVALYVVGVLLHNSVIILVALRLILLIKRKYLRRLAIAFIVIVIPVAVALYQNGFLIPGSNIVSVFLNTIFEKLYSFVAGDSGSTNIASLGRRTIIVNYIVRSLGIIAVWLLITSIKTIDDIDEGKKELSRYKNYIYFLYLLFAFSIGCAIQYDLFVRVNMFVVICSAPLLVVAFKKNRFESFKYYTLKSLIICFLSVCNIALYYMMSYRALDGLFLWG